MRHTFLAAGTAIISCMIGAPSFAQSGANAPGITPPVGQCYSPQYTQSGALSFRRTIVTGFSSALP